MGKRGRHYALSAGQKGRLARMNIRTQRKAIRADVLKSRSAEYYKTKRSKARAAAAASAVASSEAARQSTAQVEAKERTKIASLSIDQYSKLINGNQGEENIVNPDDESGQPSEPWKPNITL